MHDYLKAIIAETETYVKNLKQQTTATCQPRESTKSLRKQLSSDKPSIIAEVKRKSPSRGHLAQITDPIALAQSYVAGGADAISVLTNKKGFNGSIEDLAHVTKALATTPAAVLRKEFIIDPTQIVEAVENGADAVLLIVAITKDKTAELFSVCKDLNIEALIEVHNQAELDYALSIQAEIIGINNRNLTTFEVDTNIALQLKPQIPTEVVSVAESGIHTLEQAKQYIDAGFDALLIGETLVKSSNPEDFIREIKQCHQ